jgi:hypothetical protein
MVVYYNAKEACDHACCQLIVKTQLIPFAKHYFISTMAFFVQSNESDKRDLEREPESLHALVEKIMNGWLDHPAGVGHMN